MMKFVAKRDNKFDLYSCQPQGSRDFELALLHHNSTRFELIFRFKVIFF